MFRVFGTRFDEFISLLFFRILKTLVVFVLVFFCAFDESFINKCGENSRLFRHCQTFFFAQRVLSFGLKKAFCKLKAPFLALWDFSPKQSSQKKFQIQIFFQCFQLIKSDFRCLMGVFRQALWWLFASVLNLGFWILKWGADLGYYQVVFYWTTFYVFIGKQFTRIKTVKTNE